MKLNEITTATTIKKGLSQEQRIRRRTKRREAYLLKLQLIGKYEPSRPIKPDPERYSLIDTISYVLDMFIIYCMVFNLDGFLAIKDHLLSVEERIDRNLLVDKVLVMVHRKIWLN